MKKGKGKFRTFHEKYIDSFALTTLAVVTIGTTLALLYSRRRT